MSRLHVLNCTHKTVFATLFFFLTLHLSAQPGLVVNEISQGSSGGREFAELVVVGSPCTTVDLRGWIFDDNNGEFVACPGPNNGALSGTGIASGHVRFSFDPIWENVPVGTIILVYAFDPFDPSAQAEIGSLSPDFTDVNCDFLRVVPVNASNTFMEMDVNSPSSPSGTPCPANRTCPNGSTGNPLYTPANYIPLDDQSFAYIGRLGMRNDGDAFQVRQPNGTFFHGLSYGMADGGCTAPPVLDGGPDGLHLPTGGGNLCHQFLNTVNDDFRDVVNYGSFTASTTQSPGLPNNCANAEWIASLRRPPEAVFQSPGGCNPNLGAPPASMCVGEQMTLNFPFGTEICTSDSYDWTFSGSGGINPLSPTNGTSFTFEATSAGSVTITVTATLDNSLLYTQGGCSGPMFPSELEYDFPITINPGPTANTANLSECDNGTGTAVFDLTSADNTVNGGTGLPVTWFVDSQGNIPINTPGNYTSGSAIIYAQVTDGPCVSNLVNVFLNILPPSPAQSAQATGCDQGNGQGYFDLTTIEDIVNLGTGFPVSFWLDPGATVPIGSPDDYLGPPGVIYATVDNGSCPSQPVPITMVLEAAPNPNNAFITVSPTSACGSATVNVTFTMPGPGPYEVIMSYGNSSSGFNTFNSTGVVSGFTTTFPITETTEFTLTTVGLEVNPNCLVTFTNPITQTVVINQAPNLSLLGSPDVCAGDTINLNDFVEDLNMTGTPITFHDMTPPEATNEIPAQVILTMDSTFYALADGGAGCTDTLTIPATVNLGGTPVLDTAAICDTDSPLDLTTLQDPAFPNGTWSGTGVNGTTFDPAGLDGTYTLTFTPAGSCSDPATTEIEVTVSGTPMIGDVSTCQTDTLFDLTQIQDINFPFGQWSGPGVTGSEFDPTGITGDVTLTYSYLLNCVDTVDITMTVIPIDGPTLDSADICANGTPLDLTTLEGPNYPGGTWSGPGVTGTTFDPAGLSGPVELSYNPNQFCILDTTTLVTVFDPPQIDNVSITCDATNTTYTVSFDISGGNGGPYAVNGNPITGNTFTSAAIPSGDTYSFDVDDDTGCGPVNESGVFDCACVTDAGSMDVSGAPLYFCEGEDFTVVGLFNNDETLDGDDVLQFILHDQSGQSLGTIVATSPDGSFTWPSGITLNQPYYISPVAGSDDGNGEVDLSDNCLSVAAGIEVIFYQLTLTTSANDTLCPGECYDWELAFAGLLDFTLNYEVVAGGQTFAEQIVSSDSLLTITVCAADYGITSGSVELNLIDLADANCTETLSAQTILTFAAPAESTLSPTLCAGDSLVVNGMTYNESNPAGTEVLTGASALGCDSTITVDLSFLPIPEGDLNSELCAGDSIVVNGTTYNENNPTGQEILTGAAANGCDSLINVSLTFLPPTEGDLNLELCPGESIVVNGTTYDSTNPSGQELLENAAANGCDSLLNVMVSILPEPTGDLSLELCAGNSIVINGTTYDENNPSGTEILDNAAFNGCDSILNVQITFLATVTGDLNLTLCPGENIVVNGTTYDATNPSGQELLPGGSYLGCDSLINVDLVFFPEATGTLNQTLCPGENLVVNGTTYDENMPTGTEILSNAAVNGCDSLLSVELDFFPEAIGTLDVTLCPGETLVVNGTTYDAGNPAGTEILPGASVNGCDSLLNVNVDFFPEATGTLSQELCEGNSITVNGTVYDENNPGGTEILTGASANGCDSLLTVELTFVAAVTGTLEADICPDESLVVNGTTYDATNSSGTELFPGGSYLGCDSLLEVTLTVLPEPTGDFTTTLCAGESIVINGTTYDGDNNSGTEILENAASNGCDSLLNVSIDFAPPATGDLSLEICEGESVVVNGTTYDENNPAGTEVFVGGSALGCDSTLTVNVTFLPNSTATLNQTLPISGSITVNGTVYNVDNPSGTEVFPGGAANGCDSTVIINLSFESSTATLQGIGPTCFGGANGSIIIDSLPEVDPPYLVALNGEPFDTYVATPIELPGLAAGIYTVNVFDVMGNAYNYEVELPAGPVLTLDAGDDIDLTLGESVVLDPQAGFVVNTWEWSPPLYLSCTDCAKPEVEVPLQDITYTLTAYDPDSCSVTDQVTVRVAADVRTYAPNIFSPDADGINDEFYLFAGAEVAIIREMRIFDRWGNLVFLGTDIPPNDPTYGWDGTHNGQVMNPAVFVYYFEIELIDGTREVLKGDVTLFK